MKEFEHLKTGSSTPAQTGGRFSPEEMQHYTRGLIEANLDALVTISAEGKITDVNKASEQATGLSREELIGSDFSDYFTDPAAARAGYQQVFRDGLVRDYPLEIKHRNGSTIPVLYNASVYKDSKGKVVGVFAAARDITERKLAADQIEQRNAELRSIVKSMMGRENRMVELKKVIKKLRVQLEDAGIAPVTDDPMVEG